MSSRISIAYTGSIHIYECVNTWGTDGKWAICITDPEGSRESYNGDVILSRTDLRKIYEDLQKFFKDSDQEREK